ncbi:MAG TPA: hypothetical protein VG755_35745, partial [Nannocystaceae bacterium]|nr:hypothetical protein [Nannocystaceae bacterium]
PAGTYEFGVVARDSRNQGISDAVTIQVGQPAGDTSGGNGVESSGGVDDSGGTTSLGEDDDGESSDDGSQDDPTVDSCNCTHAQGNGRPAFAIACLAIAWARTRRRRAPKRA